MKNGLQISSDSKEYSLSIAHRKRRRAYFEPDAQEHDNRSVLALSICRDPFKIDHS